VKSRPNKLARRTVSLPARVIADRVVMRLREAEKALEHAVTVHQAKLVADVAAAQEVFAARQKLSQTVIGQAHALKIHALAKLGELLVDIEKRGPQHSRGGGSKGSKREPLPAAPSTLSDLGLDRKTSMVAQQLAALPAPTRNAIAAKETTLAQARRAVRRTTMRAAPLPDGKYRVLYADPPWHYGNSGVINDSDGYGHAERHYPPLTIAELCALDVASLAADNAVLFLWVTSPLLAECWPVIKAWGFTYKASLVWDKVDHNFGHYVSVRHELLLLCTRGSCLPDHPTPMPDSVLTIPRSSIHSQKPEAFRQLIDQLYDGGADAKLELFARAAAPGWSTWGNEAAA
jgi:N6-adenosine-specific RNA methylase IME4